VTLATLVISIAVDAIVCSLALFIVVDSLSLGYHSATATRMKSFRTIIWLLTIF